jgi:branched-chain amino acid transport system permease protein
MAGTPDGGPPRRRVWPWLAALVALLLVVPLGGSYWTWVAANVLLLGMFAAGFNLLFGYTGLLSFGHAGFLAVGAYVCAKVLLASPYLLAGMAAGVVAAVLAAVVVGYLSVRHTRIYFAMLTLAMGMMVYSVVVKWRGVTGGSDGLTGVPRGRLGVASFSVDLASLESFYYLVVVVTVAALYLLWRVVRSPLGLTLKGIRDNETRVAFAGVPVRSYRLISFIISGGYAGLAGTLMVPLSSSANPELAHWTFSAEPVLATLLGGAGHFAGPLVGAALLFLLKEVIVRYTEYWLLVLGIVVVVLVLGFRGGVVSAVAKLPIVSRLPAAGPPRSEGAGEAAGDVGKVREAP